MSLIIPSCRQGNLEQLIDLFEQGHDVHFEREYPLQCACICGHLEIVKYLVSKGANVRADGDLAFKWACKSGSLDIVKFLMETSNNSIQIHIDDHYCLDSACKSGSLELVKYLLELGCDLAKMRYSPLVSAAIENKLNIVEYLCNLDLTGIKHTDIQQLLYSNKIDMFIYIVTRIKSLSCDIPYNLNLSCFYLILCSFYFSKTWIISDKFNVVEESIWDPNVSLIVSSFLWGICTT